MKTDKLWNIMAMFVPMMCINLMLIACGNDDTLISTDIPSSPNEPTIPVEKTTIHNLGTSDMRMSWSGVTAFEYDQYDRLIQRSCYGRTLDFKYNPFQCTYNAESFGIVAADCDVKFNESGYISSINYSYKLGITPYNVNIEMRYVQSKYLSMIKVNDEVYDFFWANGVLESVKHRKDSKDVFYYFDYSSNTTNKHQQYCRPFFEPLSTVKCDFLQDLMLCGWLGLGSKKLPNRVTHRAEFSDGIDIDYIIEYNYGINSLGLVKSVSYWIWGIWIINGVRSEATLEYSDNMQYSYIGKYEDTEAEFSGSLNVTDLYNNWLYLGGEDCDAEYIQFKQDNSIFYSYTNSLEGYATATGTFKVEGDEVVVSFTDVSVWPIDGEFRGFKDKVPVTARLRIHKNSNGTLTIDNSVTRLTHVFEIEKD